MTSTRSITAVALTLAALTVAPAAGAGPHMAPPKANARAAGVAHRVAPPEADAQAPSAVDPSAPVTAAPVTFGGFDIADGVVGFSLGAVLTLAVAVAVDRRRPTGVSASRVAR
jgi:hypothetical protein